MKRPFDFLDDGVTKIDANNPAHQAIVINRNNRLATALNIGIEPFEIFRSIRSNQLQCLKCGTNLSDTKSAQIMLDYHIEIEDMPNIKCPSCNASFEFDDETYSFKVKISKPNRKTKRVKA